MKTINDYKLIQALIRAAAESKERTEWKKKDRDFIDYYDKKEISIIINADRNFNFNLILDQGHVPFRNIYIRNNDLCEKLLNYDQYFLEYLAHLIMKEGFYNYKTNEEELLTQYNCNSAIIYFMM